MFDWRAEYHWKQQSISVRHSLKFSISDTDGVALRLRQFFSVQLIIIIIIILPWCAG